MPDTIPDTSRNDRVRASYAIGRIDAETAVDRIQFGGYPYLDRAVAAEILREPITASLVYALTGRTVTDQQIADRLREVTA